MKCLLILIFVLLVSGCSQKNTEPQCYTHIYKTTSDEVFDTGKSGVDSIDTKTGSKTVVEKHCYETPHKEEIDKSYIGYGIAIFSFASLLI